jgi:hypothetical protein
MQAAMRHTSRGLAKHARIECAWINFTPKDFSIKRKVSIKASVHRSQRVRFPI